jgi:tetratricopeptide (TPR) repeat protein
MCTRSKHHHFAAFIGFALLCWVPTLAFGQAAPPFPVPDAVLKLHQSGKHEQALARIEAELQACRLVNSPAFGCLELLGAATAIAKEANAPQSMEALSKEALELLSLLNQDNTDAFAAATHSMAEALLMQDRHEEAVPFAGQAFTIRKSLFGPSADNTILAHYLYALALEKAGQPAQNKPVVLSLVSVVASRFGQESIEYADASELLAVNHANLGDTENSIREFLPSIRLRESLVGKDHPKMVDSLVSLGNVYVASGDLGSAQSTLQDALDRARKSKPIDGSLLSLVLNDLGNAKRQNGDFRGAEDNLLEALRLRRKIFRSPSLAILVTASNLGMLYTDGGQPIKALEFGEIAVEEARRLPSADEGFVYFLEGTRATLLMDTGQFEKALSAFGALVERNDRKGAIPADFKINAHNKFAELLTSLARYSEARRETSRALELLASTPSPDPLTAGQTWDVAGSLEQALSRHRNADNYFDKSYQALLAGGLGQTANAATALSNRARNLDSLGLEVDDLGILEQAEALHRKALLLREAILTPGHLDLAHSYANLSGNLLYQGKISDEDLALKATNIFQTHLPANHPKLSGALEALALAQAANGNFKAAAKSLDRSLLSIQSAFCPGPSDIRNFGTSGCPGHPELTTRMIVKARMELATNGAARRAFRWETAAGLLLRSRTLKRFTLDEQARAEFMTGRSVFRTQILSGWAINEPAVIPVPWPYIALGTNAFALDRAGR